MRRHPHVFGDARDLSPAEVKALWETIKSAEKVQRRAARAKAGLPPEPDGLLAGVTVTLPALTRAEKLTRKAATVGFDWPRTADVVGKIEEELAEVAEAAAGGDRDRIEDEDGDLIFAVANLARHHGVDPEKALQRTNAKFVRRFAAIEAGLAAQGKTAAEASLDEMEGHWQRAKEAG